ncbi:histidinol-phosphate transaminase [Streptomyces sp. SID8352]|uniref:histidinol-phosphate transaminase n=1 Tax=Streptomyces sp. SID8352 TaxID=2690338 RepID=UPI0013701920|nr:histidinol-phosphate transaminase [Streptomyces sp. SID8352]MYU21776.1 histidinol-phosphate transaminase [Streptomyces sp. SID8352]
MTLAPRPWIFDVPAYVPGRPARDEEGSLASNESPLGASPDVGTSIARAIPRIHRYPDPLASELRSALADYHGVNPEQILVGNGSDELIVLVATAYLAQGGHVVTADPAYRIDEISTRLVAGRVTGVPLADGVHDLNAMAEVEADIAYVVNPHNPTGTAHQRQEIERFLRTARAAFTIVDEAYIDFCDDPENASAVGLLDLGSFAVLRTFSKVYGLASLRIGYLIAPTEVISILRRVRTPFSVNSLAQAGALAALRDREHFARVREHTIKARLEVIDELRVIGLRPYPSQANFVLVPVPDESGAAAHLGNYGVQVRPGTALGIPGHLRISVPPPQGMDRLRAAIRTLSVGELG